MERAGRAESLRRKLYLLYMLNVSDWICTVVLLRTGRFAEINPLARGFIGSLSWGFTLKAAAPMAVISAVAKMIGSLDGSGIAAADRAVSFPLAVYTVILAAHAVNFLILFLSQIT